MASPRIAIIGAGPSGLTLASLLSKSAQQVNYTLFDLRPSPSATHSPTSPHLPSGSLDLHPESGLLALEACGLLPAFEKLKREGSEATILADRHGNTAWADDGMGGNRPEIARNDLLHLLASSVPSDRVRWETKLLSITPVPSSHKHKLQFAGLEQELEFDVVIGADGAWSRIRPLITEIKPLFSGINCTTLTIPQISTHSKLSTLIGQGSFYGLGSHNAVIAQRGSLDTARVYLMIRSPSPSSTSIGSPQELSHKLLHEETLFSTWSSEIKSLISTGCTSPFQPTTSPLFMLPPSHTFPHAPGLTLVGDAAHLMTPFAGEGVNVAMLDAVELSYALTSSSPSLDELDHKIAKFEEAMFARMRPIAEETLANLHAIFEDENAPERFVSVMMSHGPPPEDEE